MAKKTTAEQTPLERGKQRAQAQPGDYAINIDVQEQPPLGQTKTVQRWRQQPPLGQTKTVQRWRYQLRKRLLAPGNLSKLADEASDTPGFN